MAETRSRMQVLVVDDESPARQRLIDLLRKDPQVGTILEAVNGIEAIEIISRERFDVVFLDVQMPELDGFQVIKSVGITAMPLTVFVTAYDQHAIGAFEANAIDYLLKPFSDERWRATLERAKARHEQIHLETFGRGRTDDGFGRDTVAVIRKARADDFPLAATSVTG